MKNKTIDKLLKQTAVAALAFSAFAGIGSVKAEASTPTDFVDVPDYAKETIQTLFNEDKLSGFTDGTFKPLQKITRAEFYAMILKSINLPETKEAVVFADKNMTDWQKGVMETAYKTGLMSGSGYDENNALITNPGNLITRQEMAVILTRTYEKFYSHQGYYYNDTMMEDKFHDFNDISDWAFFDVDSAVNLGLINGTSSNTISPLGNGTRTEAAIFANRLEILFNNAPTKIKVSPEKTVQEILDEYDTEYGNKALHYQAIKIANFNELANFETNFGNPLEDGYTQEEIEALLLLYPHYFDDYELNQIFLFTDEDGSVKQFHINAFNYYSEDFAEFMVKYEGGEILSEDVTIIENKVFANSNLTIQEITNLLKVKFDISSNASLSIYYYPYEDDLEQIYNEAEYKFYYYTGNYDFGGYFTTE